MSRRRLTLLFGLALVLLLAGAATVRLLQPEERITADNCERIRVGMTVTEVEALLGKRADDESHPDLVDGSVTRAWNGRDGSILVTLSADGAALRAMFVRESSDSPRGVSGWLSRLLGQ